MPIPGTLKTKAKAKGITVRRLVELELAKHGGNIRETAIALGVYDNAIRFHLNKPEKAVLTIDPVTGEGERQ